MSKKAGNEAIDNAQDVIEAFGGIRPMAKKMDVAVTTVQGWKKRNTIPAARYEQVIQAAQDHDVDLSGVLDGAANENDQATTTESSTDDAVSPAVSAKVSEPSSAPDAVKTTPSVTPKTQDADVVDVQDKTSDDDDTLRTEARSHSQNSRTRTATQDKTVPLGVIGTVIGIIVLILLGFLLLQPKPGNTPFPEEQEMSAVQPTKDKDGFLGNMIPEDLEARVESLKQKAEETQKTLNVVAERTKEISDDVLAEDAGTMEQRAQKLEGHLAALSEDSPTLAGFMAKVNTLKDDMSGQEHLQKSVDELQNILTTLNIGVSTDTEASAGGESAAEDVPTEDLNAVLDAARSQSDALQATFAGVPQDDLKAAALLLGMSQLRGSLNRGNEAFESDLALLQKLIGEDNPELNEAVTRLSPHAKDGVLTPEGLSGEFRTFAGDAVVASLEGEDVSLRERANARMNEVFQVEKDGELVTGTETQVTLSKAEKLLNEGDLEGAIAETQTLEGAAAAAMQPWLENANATLTAQKVKTVITQSMNAITSGDVPGISGKLIQDKEAGINLYAPGPRAPAGRSVYE